GIGLTDSSAAFNSRNPYAANKADYLNRIFSADVGDSFNRRGAYTVSFYHSTLNNTALIDAIMLDPVTLVDKPIRSTVVVPRHDVSGSGRIDYPISASHALTGSYQYLQSDRQNNGVGSYNLESRGSPSKNIQHQLRLSETGVLSPNVVTDTRF